MKDNFIIDRFLKLTSETYPFGTEGVCVQNMIYSGVFPSSISQDVYGNFFYKIGNSRTIFSSHLDTVGYKTRVSHIIGNSYPKIIKTDGTSILGADDKAGVTIMLYMIENKVPGLYYFFLGEEVGCIGSTLVAKYFGDLNGKYDRIISFDRRGNTSVITHQSFLRCCSDVFADALCIELNRSGLQYIKDDHGVYTDSAEFTDIIQECTNISVGYLNEHTSGESQDITHLEKLAEACLKVRWEKLPTIRKVDDVDYSYYTHKNKKEVLPLVSDRVDKFEKKYKNRHRNKRKRIDKSKKVYIDTNDGLVPIEVNSDASKVKGWEEICGTTITKKPTSPLVLFKPTVYNIRFNDCVECYNSISSDFMSNEFNRYDVDIVSRQYIDLF